MSRTNQLQDVIEVNNQIRQLAPVLDAAELPFQDNGLQYEAVVQFPESGPRRKEIT